MAKVFHFTPKIELDAINNLHNFIEMCKTELTVFGLDLDWNNWKWVKVVNFSKLGVHSGTKNIADKFDDKFIDFAKAYLDISKGINLLWQ